MTKLMNTFAAVLVSLISGFAWASELEIVSCNSEVLSQDNSPRGTIKLSVDDAGKLIGRTGPLGGNLESYFEIKIDAIKPAGLAYNRIIRGINSIRNTGINPNYVKQVQYIFVAGNSDSPTALLKLLDSNGVGIGWLTQFGAAVSGCYPN